MMYKMSRSTLAENELDIFQNIVYRAFVCFVYCRGIMKQEAGSFFGYYYYAIRANGGPVRML